MRGSRRHDGGGGLAGTCSATVAHRKSRRPWAGFGCLGTLACSQCSCLGVRRDVTPQTGFGTPLPSSRRPPAMAHPPAIGEISLLGLCAPRRGTWPWPAALHPAPPPPPRRVRPKRARRSSPTGQFLALLPYQASKQEAAAQLQAEAWQKGRLPRGWEEGTGEQRGSLACVAGEKEGAESSASSPAPPSCHTHLPHTHHPGAHTHTEPHLAEVAAPTPTPGARRHPPEATIHRPRICSV